MSSASITKVLVANRGEIAVRAFRAATELGIATVAIHTYEDRNSLHRSKADESYQIGEVGRPVRAYLDIDAIIDVATRSGADAIYPGYGFLSESPDLAEACAAAGITFIGPPAEVLELTGNKMRARQAALDAGLPVLAQTPAVTSADDALAQCDDIGFPLFVKAAAGGGGRGLRRIERREDLGGAVASAMREAESAFGDPTVFLEEAVTDVRHIEVQVLAGADGEAVHLYERDCSVQRRFQKVVEIAPAPELDPDLRAELCADAVAFARHIGYRNAGTVEFLVDGSGRHVFIEMNPRIQVEHTVTEEVTDVDLVASQLRIAAGATLDDLGLRQDELRTRGFAIQCRVTAENPADDFRPDTGRIAAYRMPGGAGVRLDGGAGYSGAEISPYFDSLLVKLTCRGADFETAVRRARRSLAEFRVRGISTNIAFLGALLDDPAFRAGGVTTTFIDERPELTSSALGLDRATRLLGYLADVTVNRPNGWAPTTVDPLTKLGPRPTEAPPAGSKQRLDDLGPERFAAELRAQTALAVTDTTLRDAHQSILATRMRSFDLVAGARHMAAGMPELLSLECWGGATFDVSMRFLHESPWERLERLREAAPNLCLQMLLRGRNTVSYAPSPDAVCEAFIGEAKRTGVDVFRIFDALNDTGQMAPAIRAAVAVGGLAEGTLCYSGDLSNPDENLYDLDYYLRIAEQLVDLGAHVLCIKDMAGLLRAPAAHTLVTALRERFDQPVHLHTHDTAGGQLATYLAALDAGVDAVDAAAPPLSGMTSQPSIGALVAATDHAPRATGLSLQAIGDLEPYWEAVRKLYAPFEAGLSAPTATVYRHEIPGGQLSNLRQQAIALGLGDRFEEIEQRYAECNQLLGRPIKVTPSSKVVGDLALHLVASGVSVDQLEADPAKVDLPDSVVAFLRGELGVPEAGFPEPFRTAALEGRTGSSNDAAADDAASDAIGDAADAAARAELDALADGELRRWLDDRLFPQPAASYRSMRDQYGDLSVVPTGLFWYGMETDGDEVSISLGRGVRLLLGLEAVGEPDDAGVRSVVFRLNGQLRPVEAVDRSVATSVVEALRADPNDPGQVPAPFRGVVHPSVAVGDLVDEGQSVATIEAMKMESQITSPIAGVVDRIVVADGGSVEGGDLLLVVRPTGTADSPTLDPDSAG